MAWYRQATSHYLNQCLPDLCWHMASLRYNELTNTLRPVQNGWHFANNVFKSIFVNGNYFILIHIWLKFVPEGLMHWAITCTNGPLTRYIKLRVAHAPGMPGKLFTRHRFQREPLVSDPCMHHGTCVMHVPWCMLGSITLVAGKTFPAFLAHAQPAILRIWQEALCEQVIWRHWATMT